MARPVQNPVLAPDPNRMRTRLQEMDGLLVHKTPVRVHCPLRVQQQRAWDLRKTLVHRQRLWAVIRHVPVLACKSRRRILFVIAAGGRLAPLLQSSKASAWPTHLETPSLAHPADPPHHCNVTLSSDDPVAPQASICSKHM